MLWYTHLAFGLLVSLFALDYFPLQNKIIFVPLVLFASLLPDIDHPRSKIGKKIKVIAFLFEHRGFFHSVFALIIVSFPFFVLGYATIGWAFLLGYGSHLLIDTLSHQGIMYFHPVLRWRIRGVISTGGLLEKILFIVLLGIAAFLLF